MIQISRFLKKLRYLNYLSFVVSSSFQVSLSLEDLSVLRRYLQSEKTIEEFGLREDLRFALENFLVEVSIF